MCGAKTFVRGALARQATGDSEALAEVSDAARLTEGETLSETLRSPEM